MWRRDIQAFPAHITHFTTAVREPTFFLQGKRWTKAEKGWTKLEKAAIESGIRAICRPGEAVRAAQTQGFTAITA